MKQTTLMILMALSLTVNQAMAETMTLTSLDISQGKMMSSEQEFNGFGCTGKNLSPQLSWANAPKATKAFAIMVYDPDAPTGSGWWHWQVVNIPKDVNSLEAGAGDGSPENMPEGSLQIENDYGFSGFGGACPPKGHGQHRYQFTVYALSKKLNLPENASGALTGYNVKANALASASLEARYQID